MEDNLSHKKDKEELRSENDFLKMKLMLERGAEFHVTGNENELPPFSRECISPEHRSF
jgi:hypothetical protein